jgi:MerR family transcriptional regulator/heat shock protein HspR
MQETRIIYLREVAEHCGLGVSVIEELMEQGLLAEYPEKEADFFTDTDIEFLQRVRRLQDTLGVNLEGIEIILNMREQIIKLQEEMRRMRQS